MSNRLGDRVAGALVLALAVGIFAYTFALPSPAQPTDPGVTALPRMIAVLIGVLALVVLARPEEGETLPRGGGALRVGVTAVLLLLYGLVMDSLGFVITTIVFLLAVLLLIGVRRPVTLVLVPLGVSVGMFLLFRVLLEVSLPVSGMGGLPI